MKITRYSSIRQGIEKMIPVYVIYSPKINPNIDKEELERLNKLISDRIYYIHDAGNNTFRGYSKAEDDYNKQYNGAVIFI